MKRSTLFLAAALGGALLADVVLYGAVADLAERHRRVHGELVDTRARLHQTQGRLVSWWPDHPAPSLFTERLVLPAPMDDPAYTPEVSGG